MTSNQNPDSRLAVDRNRTNRETEFTLTSITDLLQEPEETVPYVVDRMLPCGGFSILAAKPKVGKSTVARNLAVAVAGAVTFFGRKTARGKVIYLCLEEKRSEVAAHFRRMGASEADIYIHTGQTPEDAIGALTEVIREKKPALVIIDPLSRFVRLNDFNDYAQVTRKCEPLIDLARTSDCHILALHHSGKRERGGGDAVLGSTGFFGAVDTLLEMTKRRDGVRTLKSIQRYGDDLPEIIVQIDPDSGFITEGGDVRTVQLEEYKTKVREALESESMAEPDITKSVGGNQTLTARAIRELFGDGILARTGAGKKGDAFLYHLEPEQEETWIVDSTL
jgi:RecA-family ATPase